MLGEVLLSHPLLCTGCSGTQVAATARPTAMVLPLSKPEREQAA